MSARARRAPPLSAAAAAARWSPRPRASGRVAHVTLEGWYDRARRVQRPRPRLDRGRARCTWTRGASPGRRPGAQRVRLLPRRGVSRVAARPRRRRRFAGAPETLGLGAHQHRRDAPGALAPMPARRLRGGALARRRVAAPVIWCCDGEGIETVIDSDGRADALPQPSPRRGTAAAVRFVQLARTARQVLRRQGDAGPAPATAGPRRAPGLVALAAGTGAPGSTRPRRRTLLSGRPRRRPRRPRRGGPSRARRAASGRRAGLVAVLSRAGGDAGGRVARRRRRRRGARVRVWSARAPRRRRGRRRGGRRRRPRGCGPRAAGALRRGPRARRRRIDAVGGRRRGGWRGSSAACAAGPARGRAAAGERCGEAARAALAALVAALLAARPGRRRADRRPLQDDDLVNVRGAGPRRPPRRPRRDRREGDPRRRALAGGRAAARPADAREPRRPGLRLEPLRRDRARPARRAAITAILDFYLTPAWASRSGTPARPRRAPPTAPASPAAIARRYSGVVPRPARRRPARRCAASRCGTSRTCPGSGCPQCRRGAARQGAPGVARRVRRAAGGHLPRDPRGEPARPGDRRRRRARRPQLAHRRARRTGAAAVGSLDFARLVADEGPPIDAWSMHIYPIGGPLQAFFVPSWSTLPRVVTAGG